MKEHKDYESYDFDRLTEGSQIKIEHTVYGEPDISGLVSKPLIELLDLHAGSVMAEKAVYENVRQAARDWEKQAALTQQFNRAIEYVQIPKAEHSYNKWVKAKDSYGYDSISNAVYKMSCRLQEGYSWRGKPAKWEVRWHIYTNSPHDNYNEKVAGQERSFADKASAEKYLQGRIKAYAHLFTEISPPIPDEYTRPFIVHGQLLPGYTTEAMQKAQEAEKAKTTEQKPSIRKQLNSAKVQEKTESSLPAQKRYAPEL